MLAQMPWRVFEEWAIYAREEPFGQLALRLGYAAAALGNLLAKPKRKRAWQPSDFMPDAPLPTPTRQAQADADQHLAQMMIYTRMVGGKVIDKRKQKRASRD